MIDENSIRKLIRTFILEEILEDVEWLDESDVLLADDMVDSLGMVRLVAFIEERLGIIVPPEDFTVENFLTVGHIADYLQRLGR